MTTSIQSVDSTTSKIQVGGVDAFSFKANGVMDGIASINGGQLAGLRNKLIGGHFDKNPWQRGTTFTVTVSGTYVADRWRVDFDGTANITVSKVVLPTPQVINGVWCSYGLKFLVNSKSGNTFIRLSQRIEFIDTLTTMSATLQTAILGSGSFTVPVAARQNFGSGGSADVVTPFASNLSVTSSLQQLNTGLIVPTIALKTIGTANDYVATEYDLLAVPVAGYVVIALAQFEPGSVATVFEQRDYGDELRRCQRYLPAVEGLDVFTGYAISSTAAYISIPFKVPARVQPSGIIATGFGNIWNGSATYLNVTSVLFQSGNLNSCAVSVGVASGFTTGQGAQYQTPKILFTGCEL